MLLALGVLLLSRLFRGFDKRRSPLTLKVLNLPGEGLRRSIEKHDEGFNENASLALVVGPLVLMSWLLIRLDRIIPDWTMVKFGAGDWLLIAIAVAMVGWCAWRMIFHANRRRLFRQGLEAEQAVAQCLMPLMAEGMAVFHDFPGDKFNIDHVVVGRGAVFAVETKSRKKPEAKGRESARVNYDGKRLEFPEHVETKPLQQALVQAQWLQKFLASGVGEPVRVIPVLALPGWYVESRAPRPEVLVSNCHNPSFMASNNFGPEFDGAMRKRIAHVLAERYPNQVAP
jgi:hypothetical protein